MDNRKVLYGTIGLVVIVSALFILFFIIGGEKKIKNYPSTGTDIVAFGDSLVQGIGASTPDKNFISILSSKTGKPIVNLGVSGNTTAEGLSRIDELDKYNIKVALLLLGGNDYLRKVPIDETFSNLEKIISKIQSKGAVVLLLGVRGGLLNDKFDSKFEDLSQKYETAYVPDVLDGILANAKYMSDAIHPNDAGYAVIGERIYPVLQKLLK
ncbi:MAG: GDSL-type esterase/lipase family protein [Minisyncoccia bacterium]